MGEGRNDRAVLGEWKGRGKTIKISRARSGELLVDMGPGVPALTLVLTSREGAWPMTWAVVRRSVGQDPGSGGTVYNFELPSLSSPRLLVKKPSGDGVVEFERVGEVEPNGTQTSPVDSLEKPARRQASRSRSRPRSATRSPSREQPARPPPRKGGMSFADSLVKLVAEKKVVNTDRERLAEQWLDLEKKLLDSAVKLFKARCVREAENQRCQATVSFEVLTREIEGFPKRHLVGSTYHVGSWEEASAEAWLYATRGVMASFSPGAKILFAEVLQAMLPKFVDRVRELGFQTCNHEAGTWKVSVTWKKP